MLSDAGFTGKNSAVYPLFGMIHQLLQIGDEPAQMESVADGMMDLNREREFPLAIRFFKPSGGKNGQQPPAFGVQVQIEAGKGYPGNGRNRKAVGWFIRLGCKSGCVPVSLHIGKAILIESCEGGLPVGPDGGEGFSFRMENGVGRMHVQPDAGLSVSGQAGAELGIPVYHQSQQVKLYRVELQLSFLKNFSQPGNIHRNGHAVFTGNGIQIVFKIRASGPIFQINQLKRHGFFLPEAAVLPCHGE